MFSNMAASLIKSVTRDLDPEKRWIVPGRIETTVPKAKELRPYVEKLITVAKRGVKANEPKGRTLAAKRQVGRDIQNDDVLAKLFGDLAPRFMERPGGYTRILKLGFRRGDGAETAMVELVGSEFDPKKAAEEKAAAEAAGTDSPAREHNSISTPLSACRNHCSTASPCSMPGGSANSSLAE